LFGSNKGKIEEIFVERFRSLLLNCDVLQGARGSGSKQGVKGG
jgi:hypothetical protein